MELWEASCAELTDVVRRRDVSPVELVETALRRIERLDPAVNAFVAVDGERALDEARALERRIATGERTGALAGLPLAVKDAEDAAGYRTTHGDPALTAAPPAGRDSIQVSRLRAAGAIVVGKTNLPTHSSRAETDNRVFGITRNPWARDHVAGGSSGGSAAALAAGMVPVATGADMGGSIRIPASACGVAGFKPTSGVVPTADAYPGWGPMLSRAPMGRRMSDVALTLDAAAGPSTADLYSVAVRGSFVEAAARGSLRGLSVAWSPTLGYAHPDPTVVAVCRAAVETMGDLGARISTVERILDRDPGRYWVKPALLAVTGEILDASERIDRARLDPMLLDWVDRARRLTALDLLAVEQARHEVALRFAEVFADHDLVACPVTSLPPPRIDEAVAWSEYAHVFNLTTGPAASVPAGFVRATSGQELPVGLQLAGPRLADLTVMAAAAALDRALQVSGRLAPVETGRG